MSFGVTTIVSSIREVWFSPVLAQVLENRQESLVLVGAGIVHLGLNLAGLPGWVCPFRAATGIPCPGCGLTTAMMELLKGDFIGSLKIHAFAPVFMFLIALMLVTLVLPERARRRVVAGIAAVEVRSGMTAWILLALFVYWGARLRGAL